MLFNIIQEDLNVERALYSYNEHPSRLYIRDALDYLTIGCVWE